MGYKFDRNYVLTIETRDGNMLTIEKPFSMAFDVTRNVLTSANVCQVQIYNLSKNNQNQIRVNMNDFWDKNRKITLKIGYGNNLVTIFSGNITQAWSSRQGVDFVTTIECFDGGFAFVNGNIEKVYPAGTNKVEMLKDMMAQLPGVTPGSISKDFDGTLTRASAYSGNTCKILKELTGGAFYVDNGVANILGENDCTEDDTLVINAQSGLLGTPIRENTFLRFEMILEPRLVIGQLVKLESSTLEYVNGGDEVVNGEVQKISGYYKAVEVKHKGMISESTAGTATTSVGLYFGTRDLIKVFKR